MQAILKNKTLLMGLAVALIVLVVLNTLSSSQDESVVAEDASAQAPGTDLLMLSDELSKVTLGQDLFSSLAYKNLVDFTVPAVQQSIGRTNPFEIIGRD